jgi:hypothetical protein
MSFAEGSPARTSATQVSAQELKARAAAYGQSTPELLARFDPDTSSWRTSQRCLVEGWAAFLETWPRSGLMRSGTAYQLPPLVRLTDATEFGSLLPTPRAEGMDAMGSGKHAGDSLLIQARMWPTPAAMDTGIVTDLDKIQKRRAAVRAKGINGNGFGMSLGEAVRIWPTPTARDYRTGDRPESRRARMKSAGDWHSPNLNDVAAPGGQLNPTWVEWLMGFPPGWTDCGASATRSSRKSQSLSGERS